MCSCRPERSHSSFSVLIKLLSGTLSHLSLPLFRHAATVWCEKLMPHCQEITFSLTGCVLFQTHKDFQCISVRSFPCLLVNIWKWHVLKQAAFTGFKYYCTIIDALYEKWMPDNVKEKHRKIKMLRQNNSNFVKEQQWRAPLPGAEAESPSPPQVASNWRELPHAKLEIFAHTVQQQWAAALNTYVRTESEQAADRLIPLLAALHTRLLCDVMHRSGQYVVVHPCTRILISYWVNGHVRGGSFNLIINVAVEMFTSSTRAAASARWALFSSTLMSHGSQ